MKSMKFYKKSIIMPLCLLVILSLLVWRVLWNSDINLSDKQIDTSDEKYEQVFAGSYFDVMNDHNQMIDVMDELISKELLENTPRTLVLFDFHSDIYRNNLHIDKGYEGIGNWVNVLVSRGYADEVYWVLPNETQKNDQLRAVYWEEEENYIFEGGDKDRKMWLDEDGRIMFDESELSSAQSYREIWLHKVVVEELPNFEQRDRVILSIDADYFSFNGYQAEYGFVEKVTPTAELQNDFGKLISTFENKGIRPEVVGCSRSYAYVAGNSGVVEKFFRRIGEYSKTGLDLLYVYRHADRYGEYLDDLLEENQIRQITDYSGVAYVLTTADLLHGNDDKVFLVRSGDVEYDWAVNFFG